MDHVTADYVISTAFQRWGLSPKKTSQGEWHSPCPQCGGRDRFCIFEDGGYWCRVCGTKGWLDDDKRQSMDPAKLAAWKAKEERLEKVRQIEIAKRLKELRNRAEQDAYLLGRDDERRLQAREYFRSQGISDWAIQTYDLGFTPAHPVDTGSGVEYLPCYTIPIRDPKTSEIVNCQYRIADPVPEGVGKYRQEPHLPAASFYADWRTDGDCILLEGAKKAIVIYELVEAKTQVVGLPGNTPAQRLLDDLKGFRRIYLMLDPGSDPQVERIAKVLHPRIHIVTLADKPDDMVTRYGMTQDDLRWLCAQGQKAL